MAEFEALASNQDYEEEREESSKITNSKIGTDSFPRSNVQKQLSINPIKQHERLRITVKKSEKQPENPQALEIEIKTEKACVAKKESEHKKLSIQILLIKLGISFKQELSALIDDPLIFIQQKFSKAAISCKELLLKAYEKIIGLPKQLWAQIRKFLKNIEEVFDSEKNILDFEPDSGQPKRKRDNPPPLEANPYILTKKVSASLVRCDIEHKNFEIAFKPPKSFIEIIVESLKNLVESALQKKDKQKCSKIAEQIELKEKLGKEAKNRLIRAESLRPDLAKELELPDTTFILESAFDDLPEVQSMLDKAEAAQRTKQKLTNPL